GAAEDSATTVEGWGYDALGRATYTAEAGPDSWNWIGSSEAYSPNGAVASIELSGLAAAVNYGLDGEGRPTGAAASVTLGSGNTSAYQFDANTGRMTKYTFTVAGATETGTLAWNANGTLA